MRSTFFLSVMIVLATNTRSFLKLFKEVAAGALGVRGTGFVGAVRCPV